MIVKLKNSDTKQMITLTSNGLTYLRYKELTGQCLGVALSELFSTLASGTSVVGDISNLQKDLDNYDKLPIIRQQEIDNKVAQISQNSTALASVVDKLILITASMIASGESPNIRHIDDIVSDIDLNWLADGSIELDKILECIKALLPTKSTQKKTAVARSKK